MAVAVNQTAGVMVVAAALGEVVGLAVVMASAGRKMSSHGNGTRCTASSRTLPCTILCNRQTLHRPRRCHAGNGTWAAALAEPAGADTAVVVAVETVVEEVVAVVVMLGPVAAKAPAPMVVEEMGLVPMGRVRADAAGRNKTYNLGSGTSCNEMRPSTESTMICIRTTRRRLCSSGPCHKRRQIYQRSMLPSEWRSAVSES